MSRFHIPLIRRDTGKIDPKFLDESGSGGGGDASWGHYFRTSSVSMMASSPGGEGSPPVIVNIPFDGITNPSGWDVDSEGVLIPEAGVYLLSLSGVIAVQDPGSGTGFGDAGLGVAIEVRTTKDTVTASSALGSNTIVSPLGNEYSLYREFSATRPESFEDGARVGLQLNVSPGGDGPRPDLMGVGMVYSFGIYRLG